MGNNKFIQFVNENKGPIATFFALFLAGYAGALTFNTQSAVSSLPDNKNKPGGGMSANDIQLNEIKAEKEKAKDIIEELAAKGATLQQQQGNVIADKFSKLLSGAGVKAAPANQFIQSLKNNV